MSLRSILTSRPAKIDRHCINWLAALLILAQIPHYLFLPWWVSICGMVIVSSYFLAWQTDNRKWLDRIAATHVFTVVALLAAVAVRLHYGYFLGRDPCVAFLFLLTACKFAETRYKKDGSLLICLCGFLLLTQYFYSQSILAAVISLPAVLAIGGSFYVLGNTSQTFPQRSGFATAVQQVDKPGTAMILGLVCKLLLQGLPIAALLFILFPRLPGPMWNLPDDAQAQTGLSDSMRPGSISDLSKSDEVAFRVDFNGPVPGNKDLYWRGPVLALFDGREWTMQKRLKVASPAFSTENTIDYTVTLQANRQRWLFALDQPASLPRQVSVQSSTDRLSQQQGTSVLARLTSDRQLIANKLVTSTVRYQQKSTLGSYYTEQNPELASNTQIAGRNSRTEAFARKTRLESTSDSDYVKTILRWFRNEPFYYTLKPPLLGDSPIDEFLFQSRRGFCEHYASAFTFMMRAAGIPARVVTGYQGGEMNDDYMIVRQSDAHAWSEVLINGQWNRFDPTAAVAPARVEQGLADSLSDGEPVPALARRGASWMRSMQLHWDSVNHDWQRLVVDFNNDSQTRFWDKLGFLAPKPWQMVSMVIAIAGIWCVLVLGWSPQWLRARLRKKDPVERLWSRYCHHLAKAGLPIAAAEGPADYHNRVAEKWPQLRHILDPLASHLTELQYGSPDTEQRELLLEKSESALKHLLQGRLTSTTF